MNPARSHRGFSSRKSLAVSSSTGFACMKPSQWPVGPSLRPAKRQIRRVWLPGDMAPEASSCMAQVRWWRSSLALGTANMLFSEGSARVRPDSGSAEITEWRSSIVSNQQWWSPIRASISFSCRFSLWISFLVLIFCSTTFGIRLKKGCFAFRKVEQVLLQRSRISSRSTHPSSNCCQSPRNRLKALRHLLPQSSHAYPARQQ
jgi:hypothetical protein